MLPPEVQMPKAIGRMVEDEEPEFRAEGSAHERSASSFDMVRESSKLILSGPHGVRRIKEPEPCKANSLILL